MLREKDGEWFVVGIHLGHMDGFNVNVATLMPYVYQYLQGSYVPQSGEEDWHATNGGRM